MTHRHLHQLRRIRWAVRATLLLGVAASVAANILHARHNPISQTISAWPPLALLLTVELTSRIPMHKRSLAALRVLATVAIAGIAAWVSYWHMAGVADRYGETGASPYLLPVSVDGLIVVASISLVELAARIRTVEDTTTGEPSTVGVVVPDGPGTVPAGRVVVLDDEDQAVDTELITRAQAVARRHYETTGRAITRDQLRAELRISNATAGELLHRIRTEPSTPDTATRSLIGELTR